MVEGHRAHADSREMQSNVFKSLKISRVARNIKDSMRIDRRSRRDIDELSRMSLILLGSKCRVESKSLNNMILGHSSGSEVRRASFSLDCLQTHTELFSSVVIHRASAVPPQYPHRSFF